MPRISYKQKYYTLLRDILKIEPQTLKLCVGCSRFVRTTYKFCPRCGAEQTKKEGNNHE